MDPRLAAVPVVLVFADAVQSVDGVVGLYIGGSIAAGDYVPGVSDIDALAVVATDLDDEKITQLGEIHRATILRDASATKLHCAYLPQDDAEDVRAAHPYWALQRFHRRHVTGVARAEVLRGGITVFGPPASTLLPGVDDAALRQAVRAELIGYWSGALRRPTLWLRDFYVDLGLVTLARAEATLADGSLITKRDAIARLDRLGVDPLLAEQVRRRRAGETVPIGAVARLRRAYTARRLVARGIRALTAQPRLE